MADTLDPNFVTWLQNQRAAGQLSEEDAALADHVGGQSTTATPTTTSSYTNAPAYQGQVDTGAAPGRYRAVEHMIPPEVQPPAAGRAGYGTYHPNLSVYPPAAALSPTDDPADLRMRSLPERPSPQLLQGQAELPGPGGQFANYGRSFTTALADRSLLPPLDPREAYQAEHGATGELWPRLISREGGTGEMLKRLVVAGGLSPLSLPGAAIEAGTGYRGAGDLAEALVGARLLRPARRLGGLVRVIKGAP